MINTAEETDGDNFEVTLSNIGSWGLYKYYYWKNPVGTIIGTIFMVIFFTIFGLVFCGVGCTFLCLCIQKVTGNGILSHQKDK